MSIETTLQALRDDADFMRNVSDWQRAPAQAARTLPFPPALRSEVIAGLAKRGIEQLYSHQAEAIAQPCVAKTWWWWQVPRRQKPVLPGSHPQRVTHQPQRTGAVPVPHKGAGAGSTGEF